MKQLNRAQMQQIMPLFDFVSDSLARSCFQGHMGKAWVDDLSNPSCAKLFVGDFCYLGGDPDAPFARELVEHIPQEYQKEIFFIVPSSKKWGELVEKVYSERCKKVTRYAMKPNAQFNHYQLYQRVSQLPNGLTLARIDQKICEQVLQQDWCYDFCGNFEGVDDFLNRGIGIVLLKEGEIIAGASSYTIYDDGIEVEIATHPDYRQQGFAAICGAQLILECQKKGLYPCWDAANHISAYLAETLGYQFDYEYDAYQICRKSI